MNLSIKYERCATGVIHEPDYPSKGMLPVWHRERVEEGRTGRQSIRGNATGGTRTNGNRLRWTITSNTADV